jgi:hypothetical protein
MRRTLTIFGSFLAVLLLYGLYRVTVVPLIEPSIDTTQRLKASRETIQAARQKATLRFADLAHLFPKGSWELNNPKVIESNSIQFLIGKYTPEEGNRVLLYPCTIIFTPPGPPETRPMRRRQAIIMQAVDGAVLEFDKPFDLGRGQIGNLVGGRLKGKMVIRSQGKTAGPDDDIWIETKEAILQGNKIWTPHPVQFRLGLHQGTGREVHIELASDDPLNPQSALTRGGRSKKRGSSEDSSSLSAIETFELRHLDYLDLRFPEKSLQSTTGVAGTKTDSGETISVRVTCDGNFLLNLPERKARFVDKVRVERLYPKSPSDWLTAERLTIELSPASELPGAKKTASANSNNKLIPHNIIAEGAPVRVHSTVESFEAEGAELKIDLLKKKLTLDGKKVKPVHLTYQKNSMTAPYLVYQSAPEPGRVGQVVADGPGTIEGISDGRSPRKFKATWQRELRLYPHPSQPNQVLSLTGGMSIWSERTGSLSAGETHLYLNEVVTNKVNPKTGQAKKQFDLTPDRMQADGNVILNSPEITSKIDQLQVWFRDGNQTDNRGMLKSQLTPSPSRGVAPQSTTGPIQRGPNRPVATSAPNVPQSRQPNATHQKTPDHHYLATARLLQAEVVLQEQKADLFKLILLDDVVLTETKTKRPEDQPIVMRGERIDLVDAAQPYAAATITGNPTTGNPAIFTGRGLSLSSSNINLHRGKNRLWVDGPGTMVLPPSKSDLSGKAVINPQPIRIDWQNRMEFDGRTVQFKKSVIAQTATQKLLTETMEISLNQMIRFDQKKPMQGFGPGVKPDIQEFRCLGGVHIENQTVENGRLISVEKGEVQQLIFNQISGQMKAEGPGWIRSHRLGSIKMPGTTFGQKPKTTAPALSNQNDDQMTYLYIHFDGRVTGHLPSRTIAFEDQVKVIYGPVENWEQTVAEDDPDLLGPNGARMDCQRLQLTETGSLTGGQAAIDFRGSGNVRIEGRDYTGLGSAVGYEQQKGLITLEGDGRTDAILSRQVRVGAKKDEFKAQKIQYWLNTGQIGTTGARSLELNGAVPFGNPKQR